MRVLGVTCLLMSLSLPLITQSARLLNNWSPEVIERELRSLGLETSLEDLEEDVELAEALGRRLNGADNDERFARFHSITGQAVGSWEENRFDKKCISDHLPDIENADLQCRESGCRGACLSGYQFPGGLSRFSLICDEETGELTYLDQPFRDTLPPCEPVCGSGCQNGGLCTEPGRCLCQLGFEGDLCEIQISCPHIGIQMLNGVVSKVGINLALICDSGYQLNTGDEELHFQCEDQAWPLPDILRLVDPATGVIICGPHCEPECHNGGVCTGPGRCSCRRGFWGPRCEVARCAMPKQVIPHTSMGGTLTRMNIKCHDGYKMHGDVTDMQVQCLKGKWMMPDHKTPFTHQMAHCEAVCLSGCQNGGTCIAPDECLCPTGFAGKTCQRR